MDLKVISEKKKPSKMVSFRNYDEAPSDELELSELLGDKLVDELISNPLEVVKQLNNIREETFLEVTEAEIETVNAEIDLPQPDPENTFQVKATEKAINNPYEFKVPSYIKEKLAKEPQVMKHIYSLGHEEPIIGLVAYVGSPVNGEVVVGNPKIVNDWLAYMRTAQKKRIVKCQDGLLTSGELNKLCNVTILPEGRHRFNIGYDTHPGIGCKDHDHTKYLWRSASYPCAIVTCNCPQL